jgi:5'-3' exonuclease
MVHLLVLDMSSVLYRTFYTTSYSSASKQYVNSTDDKVIRMAYVNSLLKLNKVYSAHKPDRMILVFDRDNWRLKYTQSEECYSKRIYKGHRRQSMTPAQLSEYKLFKQFMHEFEEFLTTISSIPCLSANLLEADDIIAGICHMYGGDDTASNNKSTPRTKHDKHKVTIVSTDKDLLQLLRYERVELIDPATDRHRALEHDLSDSELDLKHSVDYFLYMKFMRGDRGDNVQSAYPRYRRVKIREAFEDVYKHTNLMNETWVDQDDRTMIVGELVNENKLLMDLTHQPDDIQELMWDTIESGLATKGRYDHFSLLQFLAKKDLKALKPYLDRLKTMLSSG